MIYHTLKPKTCLCRKTLRLIQRFRKSWDLDDLEDVIGEEREETKMKKENPEYDKPDTIIMNYAN